MKGHHRILVFVVVVVVAGVTTVPIPECCSLISGSCRSACEQVSLVSMATDPQESQLRLRNLNHYCARELTNFWKCFNNSLQDIEKGEGWIGRSCCKLSQGRNCRLACLRAQSRNDLTQGCRQSDEIHFYTCVEQQEDGERCCSGAQTHECRQACKAVFSSRRTPSRQIRTAVVHTCSHHSPKVLRCVQSFVKFTPAENPQRSEYSAPSPAAEDLHCCEKSPNQECRNSCVQALQTKTTDQEIVDLIEAACGPPLPNDKLWQCFLHNADPPKSASGISEVSSINRMGMDSAKLHCCFKAVTLTCQKLCFRTFSNDWANSWETFDRQCQIDNTEFELLACLAEVDEPCELGCDSLSYCSNFNHRPTELFQSCSAQADRAAQKDVELWQRRFISMPSMQIPVVDITRCQPNLWKAIACTLQIKPCRRHTQPSLICRSDCVEVLSKCLDYERLPPGHTAESLCEHMSPSNDEKSCISLAPYLSKSHHTPNADQVTHPCRPNPCNISDICVVNRDCPTNEICFSHVCQPGCKLGDISQLVVPLGSLVRIPTASGNPSCHKVCRCTDKRLVEDCQNVMCVQTESCWDRGVKIDHGKVFDADCNKCVCFAGEISCTRLPCAPNRGHNSVAFTGLPCNCASHYVPVCGSNGRTYPSACLARCEGLKESQMDFGSCSSLDPCSSNPCSTNQRCVSQKTVCLSVKAKGCRQYECVDLVNACNLAPKEPVCDTDSHEHQNLCSLWSSNATLAYRGRCKSECSSVGRVCGHNGETYTSECAAWSDRVTVDYEGPCVAVGNIIIGDNSTSRCSGVECPPPASANCIQATPPGGCCPVCGGSVQILFSRLQVDHTLSSIQSLEQLTVHLFADHLQRHVQIAECAAYLYLGIHGALVLTVVPPFKNPSAVQVEACVAVTEKLALLVQHGSPLLTTDVVLSHLVAAETLHVPSTSASISAIASSCAFSMSVTLVIVAVNYVVVVS